MLAVEAWQSQKLPRKLRNTGNAQKFQTGLVLVKKIKKLNIIYTFILSYTSTSNLTSLFPKASSTQLPNLGSTRCKRTSFINVVDCNFH